MTKEELVNGIVKMMFDYVKQIPGAYEKREASCIHTDDKERAKRFANGDLIYFWYITEDDKIMIADEVCHGDIYDVVPLEYRELDSKMYYWALSRIVERY